MCFACHACLCWHVRLQAGYCLDVIATANQKWAVLISSRSTPLQQSGGEWIWNKFPVHRCGDLPKHHTHTQTHTLGSNGKYNTFIKLLCFVVFVSWVWDCFKRVYTWVCLSRLYNLYSNEKYMRSHQNALFSLMNFVFFLSSFKCSTTSRQPWLRPCVDTAFSLKTDNAEKCSILFFHLVRISILCRSVGVHMLWAPGCVSDKKMTDGKSFPFLSFSSETQNPSVRTRHFFISWPKSVKRITNPFWGFRMNWNTWRQPAEVWPLCPLTAVNVKPQVCASTV